VFKISSNLICESQNVYQIGWNLNFLLEFPFDEFDLFWIVQIRRFWMAWSGAKFWMRSLKETTEKTRPCVGSILAARAVSCAFIPLWSKFFCTFFHVKSRRLNCLSLGEIVAVLFSGGVKIWIQPICTTCGGLRGIFTVFRLLKMLLSFLTSKSLYCSPTQRKDVAILPYVPSSNLEPRVTC